MRKIMLSFAVAMLFAPALVSAHHSFAVYDMETNVEFDGVVETLKFRNPHMTMTFVVTDENGEQRVLSFEGAPANMLVRMGLDPAAIQPGKRFRAIASPLREGAKEFFLRTIILEDGTRFDTISGSGG